MALKGPITCMVCEHQGKNWEYETADEMVEHLKAHRDDELAEGMAHVMAEVQKAIGRVNQIQLGIAAKGKTRRQMMAEGVPWVGY